MCRTFFTRPDRKQRVQTRTRLVVPSMTARTRCKLGLNLRLDALLAWEMLLPNMTPLPQISHRLDMIELHP